VTNGERGRRIRRAASADAATIGALARDLATHDGSTAGWAITDDRWSGLLDRDDVIVLIAFVEGAGVGYVSAVRTIDLRSGSDTVTVEGLAVSPHARGVGIGSMLMAALADEHPGGAIRWDVEEGDLRAQQWSLRLGARLRRKVVARWAPGTDRLGAGG
jgi:ribosomal protein S18 acetylase RimI-like enzyme